MKKKNGYLIVSLLCLIANINAQNFKYNTEQFGIKGSMLGGLITAGTDDMSMIYYNPAAIHNIVSGVDISLIRPSLSTFGFKQFWGDNEQSKLNTNFGLKRLQASFKTKLNNLDLAFIKINRSEWDDQFSAQQESIDNDILHTKNFEYQFEGNDSWFGLGTSIQLNPKLHFGLTQFVSVAKFFYRYDILTETRDISTDANEPIEYFKSSLNSNYSNMGFVTKVGFLFDSEKHDIGVTITTPTFLRLVSGGDFNRSRVVINPENTNISGIKDSELSPEIKTPWEFNLGYSMVLNSSRKLWFNASYHTQIADYEMAEIRSVQEKLEWINGSKAIFNYGIGYSDQINSLLQVSGGVRMNYLAYENKVVAEGKARNTILDGNSIHFTLSTHFKYKRNTILLGFDWGTLTNVPDIENFDQLTGVNELNPNIQNLTKDVFSLLFTYGFIIDEIRK